jgi:hypothetical protein
MRGWLDLAPAKRAAQAAFLQTWKIGEPLWILFQVSEPQFLYLAIHPRGAVDQPEMTWWAVDRANFSAREVTTPPDWLG